MAKIKLNALQMHQVTGGWNHEAHKLKAAGSSFVFTQSNYLPTIMSSRSWACGLMRVQMSIVNKVLLLLKMEAREDMRAANITANIRPRRPAERDGSKEGRARRILSFPKTSYPYRLA